MIKKLLLLLVLLLTATTGAMAQSAFTAKEITSASQLTSTDDEAYVAACMPSDFLPVDADVAKAWTGAPTDGSAILIYAIDGDKIKMATFIDGSNKATTGATWSIASFKNQLTNGKFFYTAAPTYTVTVAEGTEDAEKWTIDPTEAAEGAAVTATYSGTKKVKSVKAVKKAAAAAYTLLSAAATSDVGKVVCAAGHLHDAKTAVPDGCTAVGILGKVTATGHGLILALKDAPEQEWVTVNGWASETSYAGTTLKVLPNDAARGTNLTSYTTLGETAVSNWAVAQKSDYEAIFTNLGSTTNVGGGYTCDGNVNAYITTGVGGAAITYGCWSATEYDNAEAWYFYSEYWSQDSKDDENRRVRPVLGF